MEHSLAGCLLRALNNMANIQYVIDLNKTARVAVPRSLKRHISEFVST